MNKKLIHSLFFIVLLLFLALLATNLTFDYGKQIEDIDPQMEWHFFHERFIHPSTAKEVLHKGEIVTLPHKFSEHYDTAKTYGTYIAKVTLPMQYVNEKIGLFIPFQYGNYDVYIQNELVLSKGDFSTTPNVLHMGAVIGNFTSAKYISRCSFLIFRRCEADLHNRFKLVNTNHYSQSIIQRSLVISLLSV